MSGHVGGISDDVAQDVFDHLVGLGGRRDEEAARGVARIHVDGLPVLVHHGLDPLEAALVDDMVAVALFLRLPMPPPPWTSVRHS